MFAPIWTLISATWTSWIEHCGGDGDDGDVEEGMAGRDEDVQFAFVGSLESEYVNFYYFILKIFYFILSIYE